jgi:putative aminopeptidase FrvX
MSLARTRQAVDLLRDFSQAHGAPGHEDAVRALLLRALPSRQAAFDRLGSAALAPAAPKGPKVVLTAHMDEVGFLVQSVTHDGFLRLAPLGGWPDGVLAAQRLRVLARATGKEWTGVVAALPPHQGGQQASSVERVHVDIGARSAEAVQALGIRPGDPVVPEGPFAALADEGRFSGKAFDNRAGMAALVLATQELDAEGALPCALHAVATVQEEVGCRGAVTAARLVDPDVVIVLEGPPADDLPGLPRPEAQGVLGGGVQIRAFDPTAILSPRLVDLALEVARERGIPHQLTVRRTGGTDARSFQQHGLGVPTIVLGVPARYIHTHQSVLDLSDLLACVDLAKALARRLDGEAVARLTRFG